MRIHLCLSSSLKVRPVNDDKTVYTFTYSSSSDLANDDNFVFNTEELNYDKIGSPDASLFDVWFSSAEAYKIAKAKFTEVYRQAFDGDLIGLFKMIVILICMWLAVFSWLAYLVLHYGAGRVFLEALANGPGRSARGGFDLLRILSFGLYSLDDDPKLSRVVLTMFLTVAIVVIILEYL